MSSAVFVEFPTSNEQLFSVAVDTISHIEPANAPYKGTAFLTTAGQYLVTPLPYEDAVARIAMARALYRFEVPRCPNCGRAAQRVTVGNSQSCE